MIKSAEEIALIRKAVAAADAGMKRMREALRPGLTENELWVELHHANIALGGEWIETRLLSSGPRTNPWFQECSDRVIAAGDLVSFDTDLVGPAGYCADISRTFFCGPRPREEQRRLYALALEQVRHNMVILRPGMSFDELRDRAWKIPERYDDQKYGSIAHGVGMIDEWPAIAYRGTGRAPQQGVVEPGMMLCVESYIGEVGGADGVKLEEQILVTATGIESLSAFPSTSSFSAERVAASNLGLAASSTTRLGGMRKNSVASSILFAMRMKICFRQRDILLRLAARSFSRPTKNDVSMRLKRSCCARH